jgi:6-phosphogluconolactonase (cycloisomerase 2 family)
MLTFATTAIFQVNAQLHFESLVFDGMDRPLLENASSVDISPDGAHVYTSSYNDNAISVFERDAASPSPGLLSFIETQKNEINGVSGLGGAFSIKVSPDGNHVYVAGSLDDAIALFERNVLTGELTYITSYVDGVDGVDGINGAYHIDIPADGNHIYVTGPDDNAIAVFRRNVITGELILIQVLEDQSGDITEMNYPLALTVSPDGKNVYVSSFGEHALNVFDRNQATGELSYVEVHIDDQGPIVGLQGAYGVFVSPDGENVYVASQDDNSVTVFERFVGTGELTYSNTLIEGQNSVTGISGATSVSVSPDGNYVYANGTNEDAVAVFSRDENTGDLVYVNMIQDGVNGVSGISYPLSFANSDDGKNMYIVGFGSASLAIFDIDVNTGSLGFMESETGDGMGVSGLDGAAAVAISADGKSIYAAGNNADAIVAFDRNIDNGSLEYIEKITDGSLTDGLNGINAIAVSLDGSHVYATGFWDKSLVLFERNEATGELTYIERYKDGISGVDGLNGANFVTLSPDGNNVYVTGFWEHALAVFSRNPVDGKLTFVEVLKDGVNGVNGLNRASAVDVSSDGKNVYVAGYYDNMISIFNRNIGDGTLTYVGVVEDGVNSVNGLDRVNSVEVSPDGSNLYATGFNDDAITIFDRNSVDGLLTYVGNLKNGIDGVEGMNGPTRLTVSNDGEHIYVTSSNDDAIVAFRRDLTDGTLTFESAVFDLDTDVNGLDGAMSVTVSPDGKNMYAAGNVDDAIAVFSCTYIMSNAETICEGDSVVVGSSVYHESGIYIDTFNFGACKSVLTLDLTVHPSNTIINAEICSGDSYTIGGTEYSTSGTHVAELISSASCDSTVTLNLTVVNEFSNVEVDAEICNGESYSLGNQTLTTSGIYEETFTSSFGCDSTVVLDLTVKPTYNEILDEEICEGDFFVFGTQNYIVSGTYVESFTSVGGCDSTVTLNLTVHTPYSVVNESICEGNGYELGDETFYDAGTYVVVVETSVGCETEVTLNLNVDPTPSSSMDEEICEGNSYTFEGEILTETGVYTHTYPVQNGCDSIVTLNLTVHKTSSTIEETICQGEVFMYEGNNYDETGTWEFTYTTTSGCGDSLVTLDLIVEPTSEVRNETICEGESYILGNSTYTQSGTYVDNITTGAGCDMEVTLNLAVAENPVVDVNETICAGDSYVLGNNIYSQSGTYSDVVTSSLGCDSTVNLTLVVTVPMQTTESIADNTGNNTGSISINVTGGTAPYEFLWSNNATTQNITNLNGGDYTVIVTDANGCEQEFTYTVGGIINSAFEPELSFELEIYPNPVRTGAFTILEFNTDSNEKVNLRMYDAFGKLINSQIFEIGIGTTNKNIQMPNVPGLYLIRIQAVDGSSKTFELSVQ